MATPSSKTPTRSCGECVACCTYLRINQPGELEKDGLCHCPYARMPAQPNGRLVFIGESPNGDNCRVHDGGKPAVCFEYGCLWIAGYGEDEDRPDRSGVLVDRVLGIENAIECKPLWEGAQDSPEGTRAIERMSRDYGAPALVASFPERKMLRVVGRGVR